MPNTSGAHLNTGTAPHSASPASTLVYVSLPPGSMPDGRIAAITDARLGSSASATFTDGGFDPVGLAAATGDTLTLTIRTKNGESVTFMRAVPGDGRPVIVRTSPPPHKRDVPLNARMAIVFSEPIDAATLTDGSVRLSTRGVGGHRIAAVQR